MDVSTGQLYQNTAFTLPDVICEFNKPHYLVAFTPEGPKINGGSKDIEWACNDGIKALSLWYQSRFAKVDQEPDKQTCVDAVDRNPYPGALPLREMAQNMWLCLRGDTQIVALHLKSDPKKPGLTFTATGWLMP